MYIVMVSTAIFDYGRATSIAEKLRSHFKRAIRKNTDFSQRKMYGVVLYMKQTYTR